MSLVVSAIASHAATRPDACALEGDDFTVSYRDLDRLLVEVAGELVASEAKRVAMLLDNGPLWAVLDLALIRANLVSVPLPGFFSPPQLLHAIADAAVDVILTDRVDAVLNLLRGGGVEISEVVSRERCGRRYAEIRCRAADSPGIPENTAKVTYTSGTTGNPKGVCLGLKAIETVAKSLQHASSACEYDRYLSVLPLSTLLENIGGIYVPLMAGASCKLLPLEQVGLFGASKLDVARMGQALAASSATCTILTPQLLQALVHFCRAARARLDSLRFVAIGGAPVAGRLLHEAAQVGLPVYEGYGLSECASVVSLNTVAANLPGSVGKPLPHVDLKFAEDGEILVKGSVMLGYSKSRPLAADEYYATGDTGFLDQAGFLHLTGRKKNIFITSFGRNVAPEWVERELTHHPAIMQAAVFGEGRPWNVAVLVPRDPAGVEQALQEANSLLPDYARVRAWVAADAPFSVDNGQLTGNGRLKRDLIWPVYRERIEKMYDKENDGVL